MLEAALADRACAPVAMTSEPRNFGELLRRYRIARGLTQEALAERAGVSVRGLSDLERGVRQYPHADTVRRLAEALGLPGEERARLADAAIGSVTHAEADSRQVGLRDADKPRSFGALLREHRLAAGLSQEELAERAGLSRRGIADLERGARNFPLGETVRRLAEALDLPPAERAALLGTGQRTLSTDAPQRYALPVEPSTFVGREQELSELELVLKSGRLLTLTGPGGIGKTRLALEVARRLEAEYADGGVYVDLAPVTDPALVPQAVALALGVREERNRPLIQTVQGHLAARQLLFILDNCEHLLEASARLVDALARNCPELRLLATSREPMRINAERAWPVPPLRLDEACELFIERARAAHARMHLTAADNVVIAEICQKLDGMPLAIQLAAARVPALALPEIAARLSERLRVLSSGARLDSPRHRTLRAAIDWSYSLLSDGERRLFEQLAVFAGGWDLSAAEQVCTSENHVLDVLANLVDKSLVVAERSATQMRYRFLETIREYALEHFEASVRANDTRRRHLAYYRSLAEAGAVTRRGVRYTIDMDLLKLEHENLLAALGAALALDDVDDGLALCQALGGFWLSQGFLNEGQQWFERFLEQADNVQWERLSESLCAVGRIAEYRGAFELARRAHQRSLSIAREHHDLARAARALYGLGDTALHEGEHDEAARYLEEGLTLGRRVGISSDLAEALVSLADIADTAGEFARARQCAEEALQIQRHLGDPWGIAFVLNVLAQRERRDGHLERAQALLEDSQALWRQSGSRMGERASLMNLAVISFERGAIDTAANFARGSLELCQEMAETSATTARCLEIAAAVLQACGGAEVAVRLLAAAHAQRETLGSPVPPNELPERERTLNSAREAAGTQTFEQAWERGLELTMHEAIELAANSLPISLSVGA